MTPIGIPSGWEMNAACMWADGFIPEMFDPVRYDANTIWNDSGDYFDDYSLWFLNGNHTIHPEAEC